MFSEIFAMVGEQNLTNHDIEEEKLFRRKILSREVKVVLKLKQFASH